MQKLDYDHPLRSHLAYAWCVDCAWRDDTEWAHVEARKHGEVKKHVVQVFDPDPTCGAMALVLGVPHDCSLDPDHGGEHGDGKVRWGR